MRLDYNAMKEGRKEKALDTISKLTNEELTDYISLDKYLGIELKTELMNQALQRLISKL